MGSRGPAPKKESQRTRRNKTGEDGLATKRGVAVEFKWPPASKTWDPAVKRFYKSLQQSGQSVYYQASDANYAWLACDELAEYRAQGGRGSAVKFQTIITMLGNGLMLTEGERRRARLELEPEVEPEEDELAKKRRELQSMAKMKAPQSPGATGSG